jgi:hypothetical protein
MALRNTRKAGNNPVHVEVARFDELPAGVADPNPSTQAAVNRDPRGRLADTESARELGRRGGLAKAGQTRLSGSLALGEAFADPRFEPYARSARAFRKAHVQRLAKSVGGGECGPGPASIVASASLQLAASRFAFEVLGDMALGSRLANDSRQNLLAAHELCAREAQARPRKIDAFPWLNPTKEGR